MRVIAPELLAEVIARPDDYEARLRYADALEAEGDTDWAALIRIDGRLKTAKGDAWNAVWNEGYRLGKKLLERKQPGLSSSYCEWEFTRGFIEKIKVHDSFRLVEQAATAFRFHPIRHLQLSQHGATGAARFAVRPEAARLVSLSIFLSSNFATSAREILAEGGAYTSLTQLGMTHCYLTDCAAAFGDSPQFPRVEDLRLYECLPDAGALGELLASRLGRALTSLRIESDELGVVGGRALAASGGGLRSLALNHVVLDAKGTEALADGTWEKLEALELNFSKLGKKGLVSLLRSKRFPKLRELSLERTGFGVDAVRALVESPLCETVETLSLDQNSGFDDSAATLLAAGRFPRLTRVDVFDTRIGMPGFQALRDRFPHVMGVKEDDLRAKAAQAAQRGLLRAAPVTAPVGERVRFADENLTLLVIDQLRTMGILPPFNRYFVIDPDEDDEDDEDGVNFDVKHHLLATPITRDMVAKIETLVWDGGCSIWHDIWMTWDGEDDTFDIHDLTGIEQLENLRSLTIPMKLDERSRAIVAALEAKGVKVTSG